MINNPTEYEPKRLYVSIGGIFGPSYAVEWRDGRLVYSSWGDQKAIGAVRARGHEHVPSGRKWAAFWKKLDEIGVWDWPEVCRNDFVVLDGTGWSLEIEHDGSVTRSSGDNAYPGRTGMSPALNSHDSCAPFQRSSTDFPSSNLAASQPV